MIHMRKKFTVSGREERAKIKIHFGIVFCQEKTQVQNNNKRNQASAIKYTLVQNTQDSGNVH